MRGYLKRREDSELVHGSTGERLRAGGVAHINGSEEMSNTFTCTASEDRICVEDGLVGETDISFVQHACHEFDGSNRNV